MWCVPAWHSDLCLSSWSAVCRSRLLAPAECTACPHLDLGSPGGCTLSCFMGSALMDFHKGCSLDMSSVIS